MDYLHEQNGDSEMFQPVLSYTLNPKCVSMGELYGEYNALTSEWKDGLASTLIRSAVTDATPVRKWVVFDGPVDAMWIENMNTVRMHLNNRLQHTSSLHKITPAAYHQVQRTATAQAKHGECLLSPEVTVLDCQSKPTTAFFAHGGPHRQQSSLTIKPHVQCVQSVSTGAR